MEFERFALAGDATFTVTSKKTGRSFTYRVQNDAPPAGVQTFSAPVPAFVAVLTGPDNSGDFQFIGSIFSDIAGRTFRPGRRSRIRPDAPSVLGFAFLWTHRRDANLSALVEIRHAGRCCRCGRTLTTPESIDAGIGPECIKKMGE